MSSDTRISELKTPVDLAEYLFKRLYQVGVRGVHGVPGDYNLVRLSVVNTPVTWGPESSMPPRWLSTTYQMQA